ncbi:tetratricopeptide repeat protein [Bacillus sp. 31A1R]|uniref:Tetratricopeptide repeat protein n=1 Tax=Robertmurraya mangrovi TaxID=3098077 RepID=A0ABU5IY15_9BACI|nr:tetratricopeptide repeat protein [Bacillus sp. 31A1R]MDZ5472017.1 tetratricopeptide repeat protein [Bacillus sp. 31A1R]
MDYGPLIKFYRNQRGITQRELAEGICSISHLSKIENNTKDANEETIVLLLNRLDIDIKEVTEKEELIRTHLHQLNQMINFYQRQEVEQIMLELKEYEGIIPFTAFLYPYELTKFRYLLFSGKVQEADEQRDLLYKQKKLFSQRETYLFQYYNAVLYMLKGNHLKADKLLDSILLQINNDIASGEIIYYRALVKSLMGESGHAIHFGKMALQFYMNEHNFIRILHTLMLLGINYTESGIYEEALSCFQHLVRNAELLNEKGLLPQIYHNLGFLYSKMGKERESLHFFQKSLSMQSNINTHYLITLYDIGEVYYSLQEYEKARDSFEESLRIAKEIGMKKYEILAKYNLMSIEENEESIEYLITTVIPFLEGKNEHKDTLVIYYKLLSKHYKQLGMDKEALYYMNKLI